MSTDAAGLAVKMGYKNVRVMLQGVPGWKKSGYNIFASEKFVKSGNIVLIDLRAKETYEAGHIPRAHNIPLATLADREDDLPSVQKAPIVVYGDSLAEAEKAFRIVKKWGCKKGSIWAGGVNSWPGTLAKGPTPAEITWKREMGKGEVSLADFMKAVHGNAQQLVLDVRTNDEVKDGMFANAVHIPLDQIEARLAELPKDKEMLVHCTTGARAEMAAQALKKGGIKSRFLIADVECEGGKCTATE
ncbi:rhodanese-like domain-containing protein [Thiovibrio sp. JS02]